MNQLCGMNRIKREFSIVRTPQQNGVAERKNRTLIEAARTMLIDSFLPTTFWAKAVNIACYVQNRVLVTKPHNKTPYELLHGIKDTIDVVPTQQYILLPLLFDSLQSLEDVVADDAGKKSTEEPANKGERNGQEKEGGASNKEGDQNVQDLRAEFDKLIVQQKEAYANSTNRVSTINPSVSAAGQSFINADDLLTDPLMPHLEDITDLLNTGIFSGAYDDEDVGAETDLNNLETTMNVSLIPTTRLYKDHSKDHIIGDINSATQTSRMTKISEEHSMVSYINKQRRTNHKDYQNCLFSYFLSQKEPKKVIQTLADPSWVEAMQEELLQFRLQKVWTLVDLPNGKRVIRTKWVFRNKKDKRGIVVRNKARLVAQGYTQEEGINYDEVFASVARIEAIRLFLAYASFMWFIVYQIDVKSALLYGNIEEEVKKKDDGIFSSQDKYVAGILKKFDFATVKTASTPMEPNKALIKDAEAEDIDVQLYRSMIGLFMYLTTSKPDIMFVVCACARDSPFYLEAFSDIDYARASLDRKSTTRGCQFLGKRLISWKCKKQTIVANSTTKVEYVAAANCCGQNPVFHFKTKYTKIRHHFIKDSYEKRLIQVIKIHTDHNVVDLLTKAFDVSSNEFGVKTGSCKVNAARQDLVLLGEKLVDQHNMVACMERTDGNANFGLLLSPKQSKTVNNVKQIHATVDGKTVMIDLYFNDEDGTVTLLFTSMLVPQVVEGEGSGQPSEPQLPSSTTPPSLEEQSSGHPKKVGDKVVYTGEDDRVVRTATTATSLEAKQESGNIYKIRSTTTLNEPSPQGTGSEVNASRSGEDSMEHQDDLTDFVAPTPHDSPLSGGHIPGSDKGRPNINELMTICTKLSNMVLALEHSKTAHDLVIKKLQKKVKRLEKMQRERTLRVKLFKIGTSKRKILDKENVSKQGRNLKIRPMFKEGDFDDDFDDIDDMVNEAMENVEGDTVNVGGAVNIATTGVSAASASVTTAGIRSQKAKENGVAFRDLEESARSTTILPTIDPKDKCKGIMQETRGKDVVLIEQIEDVQARIDADVLLAERLQQEEREQFTIEEKLRMLVEMITKRKRFFVAQRATEQRSKPPTKDQMRNRMCPYLKNQASNNYNQLKGKSYDEIQKLFDKAYKQVNSFIHMDSEVIKNNGKKDDSSSKQAGSRKKRASSKLKPKPPKKLKVMKEQESAVDEQEKEEIRLYLKTMIEPSEEDEVWRNQQEWSAISWKLYECCGVHTLLMDGTLVSINMLVEKKYPFTKEMLTRMLNSRLEADLESTMAFELIIFIKAQLEE
ncbi:putative ribonuclease H-like domain-containing protein [Tanacetum coccineum]